MVCTSYPLFHTSYIMLQSHFFKCLSTLDSVRKAVRTLARICDVPYQSQPLTPQLRHHMAASVAQLVEHRSRKAGSPVRARSLAPLHKIAAFGRLFCCRFRARIRQSKHNAAGNSPTQQKPRQPQSPKEPRSAGPKRAPPRDNARNTNSSA